jgi:carbonic anhydrase
MKENYQQLKDAAARLTATVEENVLVQLENLRSHQAVAAALGRDEMKLHGWAYKFENGQVFGCECQQGQFVPVERATAWAGRLSAQQA